MFDKLFKNKKTALVVEPVLDSTTEPVIIADDVIEKSSLFNAEWYSKTYGIERKETVRHYLHTGWRVGYDPSLNFSTETYLKKNPDIEDYNPLLHFELYGKKENRLFHEPDNIRWLSDAMQYYTYMEWKIPESIPTATVVIFSQCYEKTQENLKPIIENTNHAYKVIVMNEEMSEKTENINDIFSKIDTEYAVIVSSNAIVSEGWCEKLLIPYTRSENIASASPFMNQESIFYFPDMNNDVIKERSYTKSFGKLVDSDLCKAPYSLAYCMSVNMDVWRKIGGFHIEEYKDIRTQIIDWCFRASQKGYQHRLIPSLFVKCNREIVTSNEAEYKEEKLKLQEKYPEIVNCECVRFKRKDIWTYYRFLASLMLSEGKLLLLVDIDLEQNVHSGAQYYSKKKIEEFEQEGFFVVSLKYKSRTNEWTIYPTTIYARTSLRLKDLNELNFLFNNIKVNTVFINNLAFNTAPETFIEQISRLKDLYAFKLIYVFHDHLCLCPSYFLLNADSKPCGLPDDMDICHACLTRPNMNQPVRREDLISWRKCFHRLFSRVDEFVFFSNYTKRLVTKVYPVAKNGKVMYHSSTLNKDAEKYIAPTKHTTITIGFVGRYDVPKGSVYFEKLMELLKKVYVITPVIIGVASGETTFEETGYYDKNELGKILTERQVDFVVFPSISNETFSYVVQELMLLHVPIVSFRCGGHAERIEDYALGELTDETSLEALYQASVKMINKLQLSECKICNNAKTH